MPVERQGDGLKVMRAYRVAPAHHAWQEQDVFLDVGSKQDEVHNLRDARRADVPEARDSGVISNSPFTNQTVELDGQREKSRDARDAAGGR